MSGDFDRMSKGLGRSATGRNRGWSRPVATDDTQVSARYSGVDSSFRLAGELTEDGRGAGDKADAVETY